MQNLHRLRVWRAVVASGSVQQAARNLGNSPATVSQHIIALQREVAAPLYRRDGRGIAVTEAGHALAARSEALLAEAADLQTFVDRLAAGPATRLTLGSFSSATTVWLPDVLRAAQLRFPGLHMEILANEPAPPGERAFADIEVRAESGLADPVRMRGHDRDELLDDAYVVVTEADHPLAQAPEVRMAELAEHALVDLHVQGSPSGEVIDEAARAAGQKDVIVLDSRRRPAGWYSLSEASRMSRLPDEPRGDISVVDRRATINDALDSMLASTHGGVLVTGRRDEFLGVVSFEAVTEHIRSTSEDAES